MKIRDAVDRELENTGNLSSGPLLPRPLERFLCTEGIVQLGKVEEIILAYIVAHGFTSREDIEKCSQTAPKKIGARSVSRYLRVLTEGGFRQRVGNSYEPTTFRGSGLVSKAVMERGRVSGSRGRTSG